MSKLADIDRSRVPQHVAIIMDGNGRWAKERGQERIYGHHEGVNSVDCVVESAVEAGVKYLTLYAFSTENWNRPQEEVSGLMDIFVSAMTAYMEKLITNGVRMVVIGDLSKLSEKTRVKMDETIEKTKNGGNMTLVLCISYSSRWEIIRAAKMIAEDAKNGKINPEEIDDEKFSSYLCTAGIPDPDLLIRTSGEERISNFLLWQIAYSELYFADICWPDFKKENFYEAILEYQKRERRYGKTSEQLTDNNAN